ncbi:MAG: hypothetical protein K2M19_04530 [Muribaculaceae bacterium]|nr:hypothetical protein [Muribaculaceae bacterium]
MQLPVIYLHTPGLEFLRPYIIAALSDSYTVTDNPDTHAQTSMAIVRESEADAVDSKVINTLLITPDAVIGTGMNGIGRELAEGIGRGRLYHISGNDAMVSTLHATGAGQAARLAAGRPGRFIVADSQPVMMDSLIEALAIRINNRRVYTLKPRWAWWLMPPYLRRLTTTDSVVTPDFQTHFPEFNPVSACDYLKTHDYTADDTL